MIPNMSTFKLRSCMLSSGKQRHRQLQKSNKQFISVTGAPRDIDVASVRRAFYTIKGVKNVHNLRIWSLSVSVPALSVHIAIESAADTHRILKAAAYLINVQFGIKETTMQVEEYVTEMSACTSCQHLNEQ